MTPPLKRAKTGDDAPDAPGAAASAAPSGAEPAAAHDGDAGDADVAAAAPVAAEPTGPPPPPPPRLPPRGHPSHAMLWYYCDKDGRRQGPFWPGQMRQWFEDGFFHETQIVGPSRETAYKGEIPKGYAMISHYFGDAGAILEALATDSQAQPEGSDDEMPTRRAAANASDKPQWLEDSLKRQKAGFHRMIYGPVERENYN